MLSSRRLARASTRVSSLRARRDIPLTADEIREKGIVYDKSNGSLWYDADGNGSHAAIQFAQFGTASAHPTNLTWGDFAIV